MTRRELAAQIGCAARTVARWENGHFWPRHRLAGRVHAVTGLAAAAWGGAVQPPVAP
ncbi:MAG: helix-turn-helix transcriptional regulator [bacterium]|nr:helix-turn-helix transcriptional regulator [bacterium]